MDDTLLIRAKGIRKTYGTVMKNEVLHGIDLDLKKGEFASLIGPSGCGKTTFLNILGILDTPTAGDLFFEGRNVNDLSPDELASFRNRNAGFIFQFHYLIPEFTALENVLMPTWISAGKPTDAKRERALELMHLVGLDAVVNNKATRMSGGQQQRVAIARSLINDPALVFADEPTGNLDSENTDQIYGLLKDINKELGTGFLIVTHDRHIAAKSKRIIQMKDGLIERDFLVSKDQDALWEDISPEYCRACKKYSEGRTRL